MKQIAVKALRGVLRFVNVEPATVKALIRKPPAVHDGPRTRRMPWPRRRNFGKAERRAVVRLMDQEIYSGHAIVYDGMEEKAYCEAFAKFLGGGFADAVNSGTNAIYIALRALDLPPGSEVVVPPTTDAGGTMPVVMNLCIPVPADSMPDWVHTSAEEIRAVCTDRTSAIVVSHIAGCPVDMDPILALAKERGIPVIEDCAQAHGAVYKGQIVGTLGTISAFSTMFSKHHNTGGQGGVVFTRDPVLFLKAKRIADRGKPFGLKENPGNLVASLNFNQDEISMAIGRVQLAKLPAALRTRRAFAGAVRAGLAGVKGVSVVEEPADCTCTYSFLLLRLDPSVIRLDSREFAAALTAEGIGEVHAGYPVYPTDHPWHRNAAAFGSSGLPWSLAERSTPRTYELPNAHAANRTLVRVDVYEALGPNEARHVVDAVKKIVNFFGKP